MTKLSNIYVFYGEEKYDLQKEVEKIKKEFVKLQQGVNLFYITKENIADIYSICETTTFFGEDKLIIADKTSLKLDISRLFETVNNTKTIVIFIEESIDKRTSEYKSILKNKEIVLKEFKFHDVNTLKKYVIEILGKYNVNISSVDAEYLVLTSGEDKFNLINELNKLVMYFNDEISSKGSYTIEKNDIDKIVSKTLNSKVFDMLDDVVNKRKTKAIEKLDELILQKEPIIKIMILLYKQIKQLYMIKYLKEEGILDIANKLNINPYIYGKIGPIANKYSKEELLNLIKRFDEYDEKTKIGEMDFEIGLKQIIMMM